MTGVATVGWVVGGVWASATDGRRIKKVSKFFMSDP
jgi:hypothetical protein